MQSSTVDVVLIDDHHLFTRGLALLLRTASDGRIQVCGTTGDAGRAATLVRTTHPNVALVDLTMPPPGGLAAIQAIKRVDPEVRVLALSGSVDREAPLAALQAGADGFLPKTAEPDELLHPLLSLVEGWAVVPPSVLQALLGRASAGGRGPLPEMAEDERALWRAIAEGAGTTEVAARLLVSERTAKRMTAALFRRIGAANRVHAAALAGRCGILDDADAGGVSTSALPDDADEAAPGGPRPR